MARCCVQQRHKRECMPWCRDARVLFTMNPIMLASVFVARHLKFTCPVRWEYRGTPSNVDASKAEKGLHTLTRDLLSSLLSSEKGT